MKSDIVKILQQKRKSILELWMKNQLAADSLRDDLMSSEELRAQSEELLQALLSSLKTSNLELYNSSDFEGMAEILSGISMSRAKQGFTPRETTLYIFSLKEAFLSTLQTEVKDQTELYTSSLAISRLLDHFGIVAFETFIRSREDLIMRQNEEITDISNPVIRVWEGVLAMPLIGTLDSARTQVVMESLLQEIVDTGSSIAILDISGVPAVDSLVAQHLIKTVSATRLMGAECIISGIRPEIAQTVVHLGIDLSHIVTKATLASALKSAFTMLQLEVVKRQKTVS